MWKQFINRNTILAECRQPWRSYQLFVYLQKSLWLRYASWWAKFPKGWYVYIGSVRHQWVHRIYRHCRRQKKPHWHIDLLTAHPAASVRAWLLSVLPECTLAQRTPGKVLHPGFGATDCRSGCQAHLYYLDVEE